MKKILVALSTFGDVDESPLDILKQSGFPFVLNPYKRRLKRDEIIQLGKDCEGIIAGVEEYDEYVLERLPKLQCISRCGVGIDNISPKKAQELKIVIRNTPDAPVIAVAEMTIAMILSLLHKVQLHDNWMKKKIWSKEPGFLLKDKRVGILGLGRVGRLVAEYLMPFGAKVCGADLYPDKAWAGKMGIQLLSNRKLVVDSDILTIHVSLIEGKELFFDRKTLLSMKRGSFLLNLSRGKLIDEEALFEALKSHHLGGAALDVFSREPYDGPLCEVENVILTPHIASFTCESRTQMEVEAATNVVETLHRKQ